MRIGEPTASPWPITTLPRRRSSCCASGRPHAGVGRGGGPHIAGYGALIVPRRAVVMCGPEMPGRSERTLRCRCVLQLRVLLAVEACPGRSRAHLVYWAQVVGGGDGGVTDGHGHVPVHGSREFDASVGAAHGGDARCAGASRLVVARRGRGHGGHVIKSTGDGMHAVFPTAGRARRARKHKTSACRNRSAHPQRL